jgi:two-component system, OmpR family, KDP operon response regulator KdpE
MTLDAGRILIVDDELPIRRLLRNTLKVQGYTVLEAGSIKDTLKCVATEKFDVMILDLGLPDGDGLRIIEQLKPALPQPIIVLSSRGDDGGKVAALDAGADDYVTKPFSVEELMARIRAALRHRVQDQGGKPLFSAGNLNIDLVRRTVQRDGIDVKLSPKEYSILQQLVVHAGKVLTHRHLLREVWGQENVEDVAYLRVYIRQLRGKLEVDPEQPTLIITEPGVGYRLRDSTYS